MVSRERRVPARPGHLARECAPGLAAHEEPRASSSQTKQDRLRIKELKRNLRRKNAALAETAALQVLLKTMEAVFQRGEDE